MGGFYGSVQVRGSDVETVRAAAERVASAMKIKCLVGPALGDWIGIYPETSGQDEKVGERIAREVGGDVLHVLVHDDDIMAYWFWRGGKLVDSFHSKPGYFGEKSAAKEKKMTGNAGAFDWLDAPQRAELAQLLNRDEVVVFEFERLQEFGEILGISNLLSSYEYLKDEETDEIEGWEQFVEVPGAQVKKEQTKLWKQEENLQNESENLKKSGLLLMEEAREDGIAHVGPVGEGIIVAWSIFKGAEAEPQPLRLYRSPWSTPTELNVALASGIEAIAAEPERNLLALAFQRNISVHDSGTWASVLDLPSKEAYRLDLREGLLTFVNRREIAVHRLDNGSSVLRGKMEDVTSVAIHSSGWVLAGGMALRIARIGFDNTFREMKGYAASARGDAVWSLRFSRDGRWLFCGTTKGMRIYDWRAIESSGMQMSEPTWRSDSKPRSAQITERVRATLPASIQAVAEEPSGRSVVFAGMSGVISQIDLQNGKTRQLLEMPDTGPIIHMAFSADGRILATVNRPGVTAASTVNAQSTIVRIWDYSAISK